MLSSMQRSSQVATLYIASQLAAAVVMPAELSFANYELAFCDVANKCLASQLGCYSTIIAVPSIVVCVEY